MKHGKQGFLWHARKTIDDADIVLEVVDARYPDMTRNKEFEEVIKRKRKKLLIVLNKSDLAGDLKNAKKSLEGIPFVTVSSRTKNGLAGLRKMLGIMSGKKKTRVGIIGFPNTGKSSLINALKGRKSAGTGLTSGFTKGMQIVRITQQISLIDSPGIIPFEEKNEFPLALTSAKTVDKIKDLQGTALKFIDFLKKNKKGFLKKEFGVNEQLENENILEEIAFNRKRLLKQGKPDLNSASRILIGKWQNKSHP